MEDMKDERVGLGAKVGAEGVTPSGRSLVTVLTLLFEVGIDGLLGSEARA